MSTITVLIFTYNEEQIIEECINSAHILTDSVIVVDSQSTDHTVQIAEKNNIPVLSVQHVGYVEPVREFAIRFCKTDWVFIMDADERMTKELTQEIKTKITNYQSPFDYVQGKPTTNHQPLTTFAAYYVPRKNIFARKKWLQNGGWNPDKQIRLIHIPSLIQWPKQIHSTPQIKGSVGVLKHKLTHYFHGDIDTMVTKTISFEQIEADLLYKADKHVSTMTFFRKFAGELYRRLIKNTGFRDGPIGIIESIYQAFSKTITYLFLYEKKNSSSL